VGFINISPQGSGNLAMDLPIHVKGRGINRFSLTIFHVITTYIKSFTEYITIEVKNHTTSKKIQSSEKSCRPQPLSLIKIEFRAFFADLIFPVFLKNLNTEGGVNYNTP
jgi:hypothetical protein